MPKTDLHYTKKFGAGAPVHATPSNFELHPWVKGAQGQKKIIFWKLFIWHMFNQSASSMPPAVKPFSEVDKRAAIELL